ncbi:MAG: tetratricopeptide repeat protein [candidate division KSB1 bacterium]|nr:tetratricopeptide repeat protein [candidate division KSB1 bacterium]MDZ7368737.1 tetratricopeptide repeat protein [candidate division KSB1 bacterium]MDZ7406446.1 tetratricopeptide repeat protein [candidate division KSB1 bacterium]
MKQRQYFLSIIWAVSAVMNAGLFSTKAMAQARWGFGVGPSLNSLYSDLKNTDVGIGAGGFLTRRFNSHFGLTGLVSYSKLPFTKSIVTNTDPLQISTVKFTTNALRGDLLFDYELSSGGFRPYIGLGLGGVNYKVAGKLMGRTFKSKKSYTNFDFGPSLGFRVMFGSRLALDVGGGFRLTTGDSLDATTANKAKDGIITGMLGLTIFGGSRGTDILAEQAPAEESDLSAFQQRIDQMESSAQQPPQDMQEYIRLKSKMDEMNQQIVQKEDEINTLRSELSAKEQSVNTLQTQLASAPITSASFSRGYEEALSKFYGKRYAEATAQFNGLVAQFPDHPRVSNCVYWIGEAHFGAGNYQEAIVAFNRVLSYPRSLKKDDALLMLGRSYLQLNQKAEAREAFNRLLSEYPGSEFASKAQEWLNRM